MPSRTGDRGATFLVATVEWRSEGRHAEMPAAIRFGGERIAVVVEDRWVEGPVIAGGQLVRCFLVRDGAGRAYRLRHAGPDAVTVAQLA